jgi:DNA-binding response OmpR family regulator
MLMQLTTARFLASQAMRPRVLIVDDDTLICQLLGLVLEEDYEVVCACTSNEALRLLAEQSIDVMLLDYHLPPGDALAVAGRADEIGIPMVWMTGDHGATETNSHPVLLKPFHIDRVSAALTAVRKSAHFLVKVRNQPGRLSSSDSALDGMSLA